MQEKQNKKQKIKRREIRVFVSSTFRDMVAERDELLKIVFPKLRKRCRDRYVAFSEVDLRWGITEEQAAEGQVLPVCLQEIHRCRPYFIGILGERYGWVPRDIPKELIEREPWLKKHKHRSVTELEIMKGVLNNPDMAEHAFFYFRDPAYVDSLPKEEKKHYIERPTDDKSKEFSPDEVEVCLDDRRKNLAELKERIRNSGFPVRENYENPIDLAALVMLDMGAVIDLLYPEEDIPDALEREAMEHEWFAQSRRGVYIGRQEYFDQLNEHVAGTGQPLMILGESGSGKSALIANWLSDYRQKHPNDHVIAHFIGASPQSAEWTSMVRRIMEELKRRFGIEQDIPDKPEELKSAFPNWLLMASSKGRVVLLLDALNALEDRDQAADLPWLSPVVPENVRLIVSTLPGRPLKETQRRGWPNMQIQPLTNDEKRLLIAQYLQQYTKALSDNHLQLISSAPQTSNPLYLRALLEELRVYGDFDTLPDYIRGYLDAKNVVELYRKILRRYEQDYERNRRGLVKEAMSLIWASRRGLYAHEILELLGEREKPLPAAKWSPLFLAAEQSLVNRSGLISFSHHYLRKAAQDNYLPEEEDRRKAHVTLADYFAPRGNDDHRKMDELPWQLSKAKEWQRLYDLLSDFDFLKKVWEKNKYDTMAYWAGIEKNTNFSMTDAYRQIFTDFAFPQQELIDPIFSLLYHAGHFSEALELQDSQELRNTLLALGDKKQKDITCDFRYKGGLAAALGNQGLIYMQQGEFGKAIRLMKKAEVIHNELEDKEGLQICLGNQAIIYLQWNSLDKAMRLLKEKEAICREMGLKNELASAIGNQALIYYKRGDLDTAIELHKQEANLFRDTGNMKGLELSIGNQAVIYMKTNPQRALSMLQEQENICRKRGYKDDLQMSIGNQATIYYQNDDLDKAMKLAKEKEKICNEIGLKPEIERAINIQKQILNVNSSLNKRERSKDMINATAGDFTGPIYLNVQHNDNTMHTQYFFYGPK